MKTCALVVSLCGLAAVALAQDAGTAGPPKSAEAQSPAAPSPEAAAAEFDRLYPLRDDPKVAGQLDTWVKELVRAHPKHYEILWRGSRYRYWEADGASGERRVALGKESWELGDRARALSPERVEGHHFAGLGLGNFSQGIGVLAALMQGMEGKFNERIDRALKIDPGFDLSGPRIAKGRYHFELPWPKRNLDKSQALLTEATTQHPGTLRAHFYLAETLFAKGDPKGAMASLERVLAGDEAYDPPEARRAKRWAAALRPKIQERLK